MAAEETAGAAVPPVRRIGEPAADGTPCSLALIRKIEWPCACTMGGMAGLKDFREFAAWQRAEELRVLCDAFLARPGVRNQFRRAQQLDDAAASAPRNIAEGFGRFKPTVFAQFVSIAKGSETEVLNILFEALELWNVGTLERWNVRMTPQ
jgi:four helix bundle protein